MNAACPRRVSLITALGLPTIPSPTICVLSGTVPAATGLPCLHRLRLSLADSPTHADRIEFTCLGSSRPCYGLAVLSPLLSTPHCCDAVTVRYRTALHRTGTDSHRSIPSPSQAHERGVHADSPYNRTLGERIGWSKYAPVLPLLNLTGLSPPIRHHKLSRPKILTVTQSS